MLRISYKTHVASEEVRAKIQQAIGPHDPDHRKETQTAVVWTCLSFIRSGGQPSCKAQWKMEEDKSDKNTGGKTTPGNGQDWGSPNPKGQWTTL